MSDTAGDGMCPYAHLSDALAEGALLDHRVQASPNFYYRAIATHPIAELPLAFRARA